MSKLKLYTDKSYLPEENSHTYILFSTLGNYLNKAGDPDYGRFDELCRIGSDFFNFVTDPAEADFFLLPFDFSFEEKRQGKMTAFLDKAKKYHKKTIVFFNSDDDTDITTEGLIIFRTSYYKSKQKANTFALPGWSLDFVNYFPQKTFDVLPYGQKPSVSYCGYIDKKPKTIKDIIKSFIKKEVVTQELLAKKRRGKACRIIQANTGIQANFIIRDGFWAEGMNDKNKARNEYAQNMIGSLYGIATRGGGNFSYRLLEILSCGRIPVLINTDCILPFDSIINWKEHVLWVEENELDKIDELVLKFHKSKTPAELKTIQENNRKLYVDYLSPTGFFKNLHLLLDNKK